MISIDFKDKNVVVVGGTSGINRGIAEVFAQLQANVVVISRSQEKVDDTIAALKTAGASLATGFAADVRDYDALEQGLKACHATMGDFDVLVSGAAGNFPALANDMSPNGFKSVVDIDLLGTYHVMRAAFPLLTKPGASVINISAPQAQVAMVGQAHVCAAKAGVDMITQTLAMEWGDEGVRVNSIIPGPIDGTEGMKRLAPTEEVRELCRQSVPLKRFGAPSDIGHACAWLASPYAAYVSGAIIPVDGGWLNGGVSSMGTAMGNFLKMASKQSGKS